MRIVYVCVLIVLVLLPSISIAQEESVNVRDLHRSRLSFVMGGVNLVGIGFDTFLSNKLNLELSAGLGFGAGLRYHPKGADPDVHWSPYLGGYFGCIAIPQIELFGSGGSTECEWYPNIYVPVGIHYISMSGKFSIAFEGGYMHLFKTDNSRSLNNPDIPMIALKIHLAIPSISLW